MARRLAVLGLVLLTCVPAAAWPQRGSPTPTAASQSPQTGTGLIVGQVVDAGTGQPIAGAMVIPSLRPATAAGRRGGGPGPANAANPPRPMRLITGADGRFVIRDVPKGSVVISARADGYVPGEAGQARPNAVSEPVDVGDGEHVTGVRVRLWKAGVITGTITDDAGEPAVNVRVRALRKMAIAGAPRYGTESSATTDDRGAYRLSGLVPGDYVVLAPQTQNAMPTMILDSVMQVFAAGAPAGLQMADLLGANGGPIPNAAGVRVDDMLLSSDGMALVGADGHVLVAQTSFYPGVPSLSQATVVAVGSGEERSGIDLQQRLVTTSRVSGTLTGPVPSLGSVTVDLLPASFDDIGTLGINTATTITRPDGSFTFVGVPPGQYQVHVVKAPRPPIPAEFASNPMVQLAFGNAGGLDDMLYGSALVSVDNRDVSGVAITLAPGASVSGRFEFDGAAPPPDVTPQRPLTVTLQAIDRRLSRPVNPPRSPATNEFKTPSYPPGAYLVAPPVAVGASWVLRSVVGAGRDLLREPIDLKGEDITDVVVTYTDKIGVVSGTVRRPGTATLAPGAVVFLFPADFAARIPLNDGRLFRNGPVARTGTFTIGSLPAGDYFVAALASDDVADNRDAAFFTALARAAAHVTLGEGEHKTLDLQPVRIAR